MPWHCAKNLVKQGPRCEHELCTARPIDMKQFKCDHCGAGFSGGVEPDAQGMFTCSYCGKISSAELVSLRPQMPGWHTIVHRHDDDDDDDGDDEDDDDDDAPPPRRETSGAATAAAVSRLSWVVWLVVLLGVTGGAGVGYSRCTKGSSVLSSLVWDGKEPLNCSGNEQIAVTGVTANFNAGAAIVATGNCTVRCEGCTLTAPTAVEASGNAQVTIANGSATGATYLANASGGARVTFMGQVTTSGKIKESRPGQVATPVTASAPAGSSVATPAAAPPAPASTRGKTSKK